LQANCPQCANPVAVDDARAPEKPFGVKCPKCQSLVRFPGRPVADRAAQAPPPSAATPAASPGGDELRVQMLAQLRREMGTEPGQAGRALVALPDRNVAGSVALMLARLGYGVDTLDDWEEGAHPLEQGVYALVATARSAATAGKRESLYQRLNRLSPDARRRVFVLLVGDEFKSGDGTQAFVGLGDLVLSTQEAASAELLVRNTLLERQRLYQAYGDARRRHEAVS
jgi:hypothetical protein